MLLTFNILNGQILVILSLNSHYFRKCQIALHQLTQQLIFDFIMPNWKEVLEEIQVEIKKGVPNALDIVRRKYILEIHKKTGRNVIAYYSGWLQRGNAVDVFVNDKDKNAFMVNIHKLDRTKGLDLILHTPGGDLAATESIVDYWNQMFGKDIRAVIPQISMSAGTMMALSCKEIIMGKQSNLGPIDPQMGGVACQAVFR